MEVEANKKVLKVHKFLKHKWKGSTFLEASFWKCGCNLKVYKLVFINMEAIRGVGRV
jgi:hypothetical protein